MFNEGDDNFEIENIFGNLEWKEKAVENIENEREADFSFIIENFSNFKNSKNLELNSSTFNKKNLDWEIFLNLNENSFNKKTLGCYLECKSINGSNNISVNVNAEFRLLHLSRRTQDFKAQIETLYDNFTYLSGFPNLLTINQIMDINNGFYDISKDSVTLEIRIFSAYVHDKHSKQLIQEKIQGIVKWFNVKVGYGIININWIGKKRNIFVHKSQILQTSINQSGKSLRKGEKVEFDLVQTDRRLEASNVTRVDISTFKRSKRNHRRRNPRKPKKKV